MIHGIVRTANATIARPSLLSTTAHSKLRYFTREFALVIETDEAGRWEPFMVSIFVCAPVAGGMANVEKFNKEQDLNLDRAGSFWAVLSESAVARAVHGMSFRLNYIRQ
jgi:hypothetical protein